MSLELFPPRSKVSDSSGTITPEFYRGLRELVRRVGGSAQTSLVTMAEFLLLKARVLAAEFGITALDLRVDDLETNQVLTKQTIIDVGSTYVQDATINVIDADITVNSLVMAQITPVGATYTRAPEEVIFERIILFCTPKAGSVDIYINPERGHIKGQYLINYTVAL